MESGFLVESLSGNWKVVFRLEVGVACQGRDSHLCGPHVARHGLKVPHMLSKCLFLPSGEYAFSKVLPNPSRHKPASGMGHSDTGDWEPPTHQGQRHEGPTTVHGRYCPRERNASTSDSENAGRSAQGQGP